MPEIKAVFFDIDNTLFDQDRAHKKAIRIIAGRHRDIFDGVSEERLIEVFLEADKIALKEFHNGKVLDAIRIDMQRNILKILELNGDFAEEMAQEFYELYPGLNIPIDNVELVVTTIKVGYQLGVISNGSRDVQYRKLDALGLRSIFQSITLSEELGIRKPDPRIFWKATEEMDVEPEESLYIGDLYLPDIIGAKSAGMKSCWFNPQMKKSEEVQADFEIRSLKEVLEIL
ncbi:MAG: HAD family hydrolase [Euryarchaeota archaeon]|nr:HAD family hydrolase [Euryarchaeota archaeon]